MDSRMHLQPVYAPESEHRAKLGRAQVKAAYSLGVTVDSKGHTPESIDAADVEASEKSRRLAEDSTPDLDSASAARVLSEEVEIECQPEGTSATRLEFIALPVDEFSVADENDADLRVSINKLMQAAAHFDLNSILAMATRFDATSDIQQCFEALQLISALCLKQANWINFYAIRAMQQQIAFFEAQSAHESDTESSISIPQKGAEEKSEDCVAHIVSDCDSLEADSVARIREDFMELSRQLTEAQKRSSQMVADTRDAMHHSLETLQTEVAALKVGNGLYYGAQRQPQLAKEMRDTGSDERTEVRRALPRPLRVRHSLSEDTRDTLQRLEHSLKTVQTDIAALKVEHEHVTDEHLLDADKLKHEWEQRADSGERTEERRALLPPLRARRRSSGVRDADINDGIVHNLMIADIWNNPNRKAQ